MFSCVFFSENNEKKQLHINVSCMYPSLSAIQDNNARSELEMILQSDSGHLDIQV